MGSTKRPASWTTLIHQGAEEGSEPLRNAKQVPTGLIVPMPDQPRQERDPEADEELKETIRVQGIKTPLLVWRLPDGQLGLIAGHRRRECAIALELETVPVIILEEITSPDAAYSVATLDNLARRDLSPIDEGRAFLKMRKGPNSDLRELGRQVGRSKDYVSKRLRLVTTPGAVEAWRAGAITNLDQLVSERARHQAPATPDQASTRPKKAQPVKDARFYMHHLTGFLSRLDLERLTEEERAGILDELGPLVITLSDLNKRLGGDPIRQPRKT